MSDDTDAVKQVSLGEGVTVANEEGGYVLLTSPLGSVRLGQTAQQQLRGYLESIEDNRDALSVSRVKSILSLEDVLKRLDELRELPDGWYNGIGDPISAALIKHLRDQFTTRFSAFSLPFPYIYPDPDLPGGLRLEWEIVDGALEVEFSKDEKVELFVDYCLSADTPLSEAGEFVYLSWPNEMWVAQVAVYVADINNYKGK